MLVATLAGCATKKTVRETDYKRTELHDTCWLHTLDSIRFRFTNIVKDSVRIRDSVALTLDASGNVIGKSEWHWRDRVSNTNDSTGVEKTSGKKEYKAKDNDSDRDKVSEKKTGIQCSIKDTIFISVMSFLVGLGLAKILRGNK